MMLEHDPNRLGGVVRAREQIEIAGRDHLLPEQLATDPGHHLLQ